MVKSHLTLKHVKPKTTNQAGFFDGFAGFEIQILSGFAGVGKTFIATYKALKAVDDGDYDKVLFIKSVVPVRDCGALPGTIEEKAFTYETPLKHVVNDLYGRDDAYQILKSKRVIEFRPTSYEQGRTYDNTVVIVDEPQNMTFNELDLIVTRMGEGCKIIFCGDDLQDYVSSRKETSGFSTFIEMNRSFDNCQIIEFTEYDCVRSKLVKDYMINRELFFKGKDS